MKTQSKKKQSEAIAKVAPERRATGEFTPEQVGLLKRTLAKDCNDDEFAFYLWVAKKHHLDPFTRQLHVVKRYSAAIRQDVMTIQIGIDGYRYMAARSHPDYGGTDEPEYEFEADGKTLKLARIRVWKKGFEHATVGVAFWTEYCPSDLTAASAFMWRKMPRLMLSKCAEALALRKAYPDLADIYTDEEMSQARDRFTPEGRRIAGEEGEPGKPTPDQKKVAGQRIKELQEKQPPVVTAEVVPPPKPEPQKPEPPAPVPQGQPPVSGASAGNTVPGHLIQVLETKNDGKPLTTKKGNPFVVAEAMAGRGTEVSKRMFYFYDTKRFSELKACAGKELIFEFSQSETSGKTFLNLKDFWFPKKTEEAKLQAAAPAATKESEGK